MRSWSAARTQAMTQPRSKRKLKGNYSDALKEKMQALSTRHVQHEMIKLTYIFGDFESYDPPVPEALIAEILDEYLGDETSAGYGISYIKTIILSRHEKILRGADNTPKSSLGLGKVV